MKTEVVKETLTIVESTLSQEQLESSKASSLYLGRLSILVALSVNKILTLYVPIQKLDSRSKKEGS
jgi:hypothetical protein